MTRTFIDAGVLIVAATGRQPDVRPAAIAVFDDETRVFLSSRFVRLEVVPKALHGRRAAEVAFYEASTRLPNGPIRERSSIRPSTWPLVMA